MGVEGRPADDNWFKDSTQIGGLNTTLAACPTIACGLPAASSFLSELDLRED